MKRDDESKISLFLLGLSHVSCSLATWLFSFFSPPPTPSLCPLQSQPPIFSSFSLSAFLSALCHCYFYTSPFMWGSVERSQPHSSNQGGWMSWKPSTENYFKMSVSFHIIHRPANQKSKKKKKNEEKNTSEAIQTLSHAVAAVTFPSCHCSPVTNCFGTQLARNCSLTPRSSGRRNHVWNVGGCCQIQCVDVNEQSPLWKMRLSHGCHREQSVAPPPPSSPPNPCFVSPSLNSACHAALRRAAINSGCHHHPTANLSTLEGAERALARMIVSLVKTHMNKLRLWVS